MKEFREISNLIERVSALTGERHKNAILRKALEHYLEFLEKRQTLTDRIHLVQAKAKALGIRDLGTDDKALMDEMWDDFQK